jgi:hypothetical protein
LRRDADLDDPGLRNGAADLFVTYDPTSRLPPRQGRRPTLGAFLRRLKFHFASKHAGGLNRVEWEISVVQRQCLGRRIDDPKRPRNEIAAWSNGRNKAEARFKWIFATDKARAKFGRVYPPPPRVKITVMIHEIGSTRRNSIIFNAMKGRAFYWLRSAFGRPPSSIIFLG